MSALCLIVQLNRAPFGGWSTRNTKSIGPFNVRLDQSFHHSRTCLYETQAVPCLKKRKHDSGES